MIPSISAINYTGNIYRSKNKQNPINKVQNLEKNYNITKEINLFYPNIFFKGAKREVSRSEALNTIKNSQPYSEAGLKGTVYKLTKDGKDYAIKVGKSNESDFSNEAEILKKVPKGLGQEFIDYFKDPTTKRDVLISTFASGKSGYPSTQKEFKDFFEKLLILDNAEILHGDLNMGNCLFDNGSLNLIDYGEGSFFKIGDIYENYMYPDFITKSNVIKLEQNSVPEFIVEWTKAGLDSKNIFREYLKAKGEFYSKHLQNYASLTDKNLNTIKYEENYAKILQNPSDTVIKNELRRIDAIYTYERAHSVTHYEKNPAAIHREWNLAAKKAEIYLLKINEKLEENNIIEDEKIYLNYQKAIAQKMFDCYTDWGKGTIKWIDSFIQKPLQELDKYELPYAENKDKKVLPPPNLFNMVF